VIAIIYTIYVYSVFLTNCPYTRKGERNLQTNNNVSNISTNSANCDAGDANILSSGFLFIIASLLAFLELLKFLQNVMLYCDTWRNFFQVMMILCMYMTVWPVQWTKHQSVRTWQYSAAAVRLFSNVFLDRVKFQIYMGLLTLYYYSLECSMCGQLCLSTLADFQSLEFMSKCWERSR